MLIIKIEKKQLLRLNEYLMVTFLSAFEKCWNSWHWSGGFMLYNLKNLKFHEKIKSYAVLFCPLGSWFEKKCIGLENRAMNMISRMKNIFIVLLKAKTCLNTTILGI